MKSKKTILILAALFIMVLLSSCNRKIGTGVILWSDNEDLIKSGTVVNIYEESRIRHTYTIAEPGSKDRAELETWRINYFDKEQEARDYSENYSPYFTSFAYSNKKGGLPVRDAMIVKQDNRVYKLREGEDIKILNRSENMDVGNLNGHWYKILTEDGITGYVFDHYLTIFNMNDKEQVILNARDTTNPLLDNFLNSVWRPAYYNDMITKNIIDLSSFKESYALTIDTDKKEINLRTRSRQITGNYTEIIRFGAKQYDFEGTSFRVRLVSDRFASVQYTYEGKDISEAFVIIDENVNEIVSAEEARRDRQLKEFIGKGAVFSSSGYGSIILDSSGRFIWNNIQPLISQKRISPQSEPGGYVYFRNFPNSLIKNIYSGVITFSFRNGSTISFLYSFTESGVSFVFVPDKYIINMIVTRDQFLDPLQIYFKFAETEEET